MPLNSSNEVRYSQMCFLGLVGGGGQGGASNQILFDLEKKWFKGAP